MIHTYRAKSMLEPHPTLASQPVDSRISVRILVANSSAVIESAIELVTSMSASSTLTGSRSSA
jgi:hypothetical protein